MNFTIYQTLIDDTGLRPANNLALKYLSIKTIFMPDKLKNYKDFRRNACKDATDFFKYYKQAKTLFGKLKSVASPLQFWIPKYNASGDFTGYTISNVSLYLYLMANGYFRYKDKNNKQGYIYIKNIFITSFFHLLKVHLHPPAIFINS